MSLITASNMSLSHGGKIVLRDVDLTIERGEIVTIVGPNGSGKSTLLRGLIGALRPSTGLVTRKKTLKSAMFRKNWKLMPPFHLQSAVS